MKIYTLTIVFDDKTDTVEYIEEQMTEDTPNVIYDIDIDLDYYDDEVLKKLIEEGIVGES